MPLYIGGALANDKHITLGQLFVLDKNGNDELSLQYVHDFGDWWSHTLNVVKYESGDVPKAATVAHLLGGEGGSIIDDSGGVSKYCLKMCQLIGPTRINPNDEEWWELLNGEIRQNSNRLPLLTNPLQFNLEATRDALEEALRKPRSKSGRENINSTSIDVGTGLKHEFNKKVTAPKPKNRTKLCGVCGVTVALKLCTGCQSVAYCSREHQLEHWKQHKAECKKIRGQKAGK